MGADEARVVKVGIDTLAMYTTSYALELAILAQARSIEKDKYHIGLGQFMMSVPPPGEDIITMAANAAQQAIRNINVNEIEMLLFATESSVDHSKAAGTYIHGLLGLPSRCRIVELKQACYSGTAAIQLAMPFLRENPSKKVLVIASDIARYGLGTSGESSQGCGAIALVLSANPRILVLESEYGLAAENVMDFWRPNYSHEAFVDGKYSSKLYLTMLEKSWKQYQTLSGRNFTDHAYFCYHTPVPRLVEKAHQYLLKVNDQEQVSDEIAAKHIQDSLRYGRKIGNSYTASLYIGLISLLDNAEEDLTGKRIGFYSYGSGCVAEYFSGVVQPGYHHMLNKTYHANLLERRHLLDYAEYERFFTFRYLEDGGEQEIPVYKTGNFRLAKIQKHKRIYEKLNTMLSQPYLGLVTETQVPSSCCPSEHREGPSHRFQRNKKTAVQNNSAIIKVFAPGKLILSGEHAVVYGKPALAMAVNRYVTATVTHESVPQVLFDLSDLAHHSCLSFSALHDLKDRIKRKYYRFIRGDYSIRQVLHKPFELAQFAIGMLAESLNFAIPHGVKIQVQSDLPIGCGMGSSAATIVSVMQAISHYMQLPISQEKLYSLALEAENMQHGHSSGLDLRVALQGGCLYMQGENIETRSIPTLPMYLVNTGTPRTTTGQCVEKVAPHFKSSQLGDDFAVVTKAMDNALQQQSWRSMREAIRHNHQLLTKIGVVPGRVQTFISQVESSGGAAKICGAGAVAGEQAGVVLVVSEDKNVVNLLGSRFGYNVIPISGEPRGMHAV
ncbi:MAG: hydroxymethylglutaryl-CoA synthase [Gammaproteobacteria bacterium]|nr:hydroxymethylglutaryl-CoA synthase [Gammaproteobacteria bacterium]MCW5583418.1 hydroxymethylglutaryl-CoA synthase [Gammaproteobacteria bacterium]